MGTPLSELLFCFVFYSMCGYIAEVFYAALVLGRFVNRGFLSGPYCPIYGLAVALVDAVISPAAFSPLLVFVGGVIVIDAVEYLGGLLLWKAFRQRWWDYTDEPYNIGGFICLSFSLVWGFFSLVVTYLLVPLTRLLLAHIPNAVTAVFCVGMLIYMLADVVVTVLTIKSFNKKLEQIDRISDLMRRGSDRIGKAVSDKTLELADTVDLKEKAERFSEFKASLPDPREAGLKETAESVRRSIDEYYVSEARGKLEQLASRLTRGEKRLLLNLSDPVSSRYREALERLRDITGTTDIAQAFKKLTARLTTKTSGIRNGIGEKLSSSFAAMAEPLWVFVIGAAGGLVFETVIALSAGRPDSAALTALTLAPLYGAGAAALTMSLWKLRGRRAAGTAAVFIMSLLTGAALQSLCGSVMTYVSGSDAFRRDIFAASGICASLALGAAGTVWIKFLLPRLIPAAERIGGKKRIIIPVSLSAAIAAAAAAAVFLIRGA